MEAKPKLFYLNGTSSSEDSAFRQHRRIVEFCRRKLLGFNIANKKGPFDINNTSKATSAKQAKDP